MNDLDIFKDAICIVIDTQIKIIEKSNKKAEMATNIPELNALDSVITTAQSKVIESIKSLIGNTSFSAETISSLIDILDLREAHTIANCISNWQHHDYKQVRHVVAFFSTGLINRASAIQCFAPLLKESLKNGASFTREQAREAVLNHYCKTKGEIYRGKHDPLGNSYYGFLSLLHDQSKGFALLKANYRRKSISSWEITPKALKFLESHDKRSQIDY